MATARVAEPSGSLGEAKEWGLDREDLLGIYRNMLTTRGVEERGHILYRQGKIPGSFYTGGGHARCTFRARSRPRVRVGGGGGGRGAGGAGPHQEGGGVRPGPPPPTAT